MVRYDVFISYNHKSNDIAKKLKESLTKIGQSVFWDVDSIDLGASIPKSVRDALDSCKYVLCLITDDWVSSDFCNLELDTSIMIDPSAKSRKIIPLILQKDIELPKDLKRLRYLDFTDWKQNYNSLFKKLRSAITNNDSLKKIQVEQSDKIRNSLVLPWASSIKSASFDFLLPNLYVRPSVNAHKHPSTGLLDNLIATYTDKNIVLVGIPGSGKTTTLRSLFLSSILGSSPNCLALYFTAKEIITGHSKKTTLISLIKDTYKVTISSNEYRKYKLIIYVDGVDEVIHEEFDKLFSFLKHLHDNSITFWIAIRTDIYYRYILNSPERSSLFYDVLELINWTKEQGFDFINKFAIQTSKPYIINNVNKIIGNNYKSISFLENPFKCSLLMFILSDPNYDLTRIGANDYVLYKEFYSQWLMQEKQRGTSYKSYDDILNLHINLALALYFNRASVRLSSINDGIFDNDIINDSAIAALLSYITRLGDVIIEKFQHETLMEYLVSEGIISSFYNNSRIDERMSLVYNYEVNFFVRSAFESMSALDRNLILNNLSQQYEKYLVFGEPKNAEMIREQIIYYIGRIPLAAPPNILKKAYNCEKNLIIKRAAALSLILLGDESIENSFIDLLQADPTYNLMNRSIQLIYFGDVQGDFHTYLDDGVISWDNTKKRILERLSHNSIRDLKLRLWDIVTFKSFVKCRGISAVSNDEIEHIRESIIDYEGISVSRKNKLQYEKNELLALFSLGKLEDAGSYK